jgi:arylsulfatase A-like enzyme
MPAEADRRMVAAASAQGSRLRDGDRRQVAPGPRRPQVLAAPTGLRSSVPTADRGNRLLHARTASGAGLVSRQQAGQEKGYSTTLLGDDAVALINQHDHAVPLFLYLTFNAPPTPYQAPQEYLDRYKNIADPSRRAYAASITAMDDHIGRVVAALEQRHMRDNTLIVFQSDNGGTRQCHVRRGRGRERGHVDHVVGVVTLPPKAGPARRHRFALPPADPEVRQALRGEQKKLA